MIKYAIQFQYDPYSRQIITAQSRSRARVLFGRESGIRDATQIDPVNIHRVYERQCQSCNGAIDWYAPFPGDGPEDVLLDDTCLGCAFVIGFAPDALRMPIHDVYVEGWN